MVIREIIHLGYDDQARKLARQEIENGNLLIGNTFEEYVLIQKIKNEYHLGTFSTVSNDGTNVILPEAVIDELFDTILSEEGSDDFFYVKTNNTNIMEYRHDIVDAILNLKAQYGSEAKIPLS